jgi:hypothetical protein
MLTGRPETQAASTLPLEVIAVPTQATGRARARQESFTAKLAKFFPEASPVRIPVRLTRLAGEGNGFTENTVIEFGTPREVLFSSTLPLEFADLLRLQNSDGTLDAEASVVALQYTSGRTAVAARFTQEVSNWIVKP